MKRFLSENYCLPLEEHKEMRIKQLLDQNVVEVMIIFNSVGVYLTDVIYVEEI